MSAAGYAKVGYLRSLASKSDFPMDYEAEKEGRSMVNEETVAYDELTRKFTTAESLRVQETTSREIFDHILSIQEHELEDAKHMWEMRQTWVSSGSAASFKAVDFPESDMGTEAGSISMEKKVAEVASIWIKLCAQRSVEAESVLHSTNAVPTEYRAATEAMYNRLRELSNTKVALNKRGALGQLLWTAVHIISRHHGPD